MKFSLDYNSTEYFIDLLSLLVLLLPVYYLLRCSLARRVLLIFAGLLLLSYIAPRLGFWFLVYWICIFIMQRFVARAVAWQELKTTTHKTLSEDSAANHGAGGGSSPSVMKAGDFVFWLCLVLSLLPMIIWKIYTDEFTQFFNLAGNRAVEMLSYRLWEVDLARNIIMPLGLSFSSLRAADLIIKTYVGKIEGLSFNRVLFYGLFPPVLMTGPIIEYEEIKPRKSASCRGNRLGADPEDIIVGLVRIATGFIKVVFISALLQKSSLVLDHYHGQDTLILWANFLIYFWFFYINFSGYSDLAIGSARLLGYKLHENFNYPFFKKNIAEFWANWHMSLYRFARRNAFIPLGGYRKETQYLAMIGTMMVISLWHNLSFSMVIFGLYHSAGLIIQRKFSAWQKSKSLDLDNKLWARILSVVITHIFVLVSVPLLVIPANQIIPFYVALLGGG